MINAHYSRVKYDRIIVYCLSDNSKIQKLQKNHPNLPWIVANNINVLVQQSEGNSLIVVPESFSFIDREAREIYSLGFISLLKESDFIDFFSIIIALNYPMHLTTVVLAFLESHSEIIISKILDLYGYKIICVDQVVNLWRELKGSQISYLIIDQDFGGRKNISSGQRENVFRQLANYKNINSGFAVSVIKDFDQGSLFQDLNSAVRTVSNLMLSPYEYVLFLKNYLFDYHSQKLWQRYKPLLDILFKETLLKPTSLHFSSKLCNAKRAFRDQSLDKQISVSRHSLQLSIDLKNLVLRDKTLYWLTELFREEPRASFSIQEQLPNVEIRKDFSSSLVDNGTQLPSVNPSNSIFSEIHE